MSFQLVNGYNNGVPIIETFETLAERDARIAVLSPTDSALIDRLRESEKAQLIGRDLVKDLYQTLKQQNLTQAQEGDIINRITPVLLAVSMGFLRGAREICNNTATGGSFTAGRKTFLLNSIDASIALL